MNNPRSIEIVKQSYQPTKVEAEEGVCSQAQSISVNSRPCLCFELGS